ncbi:hypothetical protein ABT382_34955 [Streptomyces pharetrae]|uniref:hypothetical protein n=1 Tax=Streptomyces pharetrae TaxID=291370 RepID=UPI0033455E67
MRGPTDREAAKKITGASRRDRTVREERSGIAARRETTWEGLYAADKAVIGDDPDAIGPGQHLEV